MPSPDSLLPRPETVAILGGGAMGTACAAILARSPHLSLRLWVRNSAFANDIAITRKNARLLPGVQLDHSVLVTSSAADALDSATMILICVPTRGIREAVGSLRSFIPANSLLVSAVKGIENDTLIRPSEMLTELLGDRPVVALGGPCHAEEVARGKPTSIVAACDDLAQAERVRDAFSGDTLRVYSNSDLRGVELGGALKNVIAIAAGICDGLGYGDNAKAALITRGLAEMTRFSEVMRTVPETLFGLAGIGDLVATCCSLHSRNRRVGEQLGQGRTLEEIQTGMQAVAEGVFTARSVVAIADRRAIDMPIAREVCRVLFENRSPREATESLMLRPLRGE